MPISGAPISSVPVSATLTHAAAGGGTVALSGVSTTTTPGVLGPQNTEALSGVNSPENVGSVGVSVSIALVGVASVGAVGSVAVGAVALTGVSSATAVGTLAPGTSKGLSGSSILSGTGVLSTSGGGKSVALTGVSTTTRIGQLSLGPPTDPNSVSGISLRRLHQEWYTCDRCGVWYPRQKMMNQNGLNLCTGFDTRNCWDKPGHAVRERQLDIPYEERPEPLPWTDEEL